MAGTAPVSSKVSRRRTTLVVGRPAVPLEGLSPREIVAVVSPRIRSGEILRNQVCDRWRLRALHQKALAPSFCRHSFILRA